jgi:hypothetical protein
VKSKLEVLPGARDLRFDTLRGLLLVCMTINHLPTELRWLTDQSLGVFSAAEGFVFLSGLVAGWVYTRKFRTLGHRGLWTVSVQRARTIYLWHLASFLCAFACVQLTEHFFAFCATAAPKLFFQHPLMSLGLGATLLYQPGLLDLLPMYCAFVLLMPAVLEALERGHRWSVLSASAGIWVAAQWAPPVDGAPIYPINTGSFNLFAWQFIFVAGLVIGQARLSGQPQVTKPRPGVVAAALATAVYGFGISRLHWTGIWPDRLFGILLNKPALGLLRIADFASVAYLVAILGERFPQALSIRPLAFLGRHSLVVVATQSVAVMTILQFTVLTAGPASRTLTAAATVALLFLAAAAAERVRPRRSGPVPIGTRQPPGPGLIHPDDARAA